VPEALSKLEPQYLGYQSAETALQTYLLLAVQDHSEPLPDSQRTVKSGDTYIGGVQLSQRLRLLGDLPLSAIANPNAATWVEPLVEGVKHFQARH
jgi:murein L,D-transpeptidase YcbB/YkuD